MNLRVYERFHKLVFLMCILVIASITFVFNVNAAEIGDVVTAEQQVVSEGVKYPSDGAVVLEKFSNDKYANAYKFDDGTVYLEKVSGTYGDTVYSATKDSITKEGVKYLVVGDGVYGGLTSLTTYSFERVMYAPLKDGVEYRTTATTSIPDVSTIEVVDYQVNSEGWGIYLNANLPNLKRFYGTDKIRSITRTSPYTIGNTESIYYGDLGAGLTTLPSNNINLYGTVDNGKFFLSSKVSENIVANDNINRLRMLIKDLKFNSFVVEEDSGCFQAGTSNKILAKEGYKNYTGEQVILVVPYSVSNEDIVLTNSNKLPYGIVNAFDSYYNTHYNTITYPESETEVSLDSAPDANVVNVNTKVKSTRFYGGTVNIGNKGRILGNPSDSTIVDADVINYNARTELPTEMVLYMNLSSTKTEMTIEDNSMGRISMVPAGDGLDKLYVGDVKLGTEFYEMPKMYKYGSGVHLTGKTMYPIRYIDNTLSNPSISTYNTIEAMHGAMTNTTFRTDVEIVNVDTLVNQCFYYSTFEGNLSLPDVTVLGRQAFYRAKITGTLSTGELTDVGESAFDETILGAGSRNITVKDGTVGAYAFRKSNIEELTLVNLSNKFNTSMVTGNSQLTRIYLIGTEIDSSSTKANLNSTVTLYCEEGSTGEAWAKNNSVSYKILTEEDIENLIKGEAPKIDQDDKIFEFSGTSDLKFTISLGKAPAGATGVKSVMVDNNKLDSDDYSFNGTNTITIKNSFLKTLSNGSHTVSVVFSNGTFKSGATIYVMGSTVPVVDPNKPPEALDTIKYEFYKDYPDFLIIPVTLNGATEVTQLKIGTDIVDPDYYELDEGAIVIDYEYLNTLDAGKYRILPTFNDPAITTLNNIQLLVYENAADRAAPYLLQTRILFKGEDFKLKFDSGLGDLEALSVLALVVDDDMILQNGDVLPFTSSNVNKTKKMMLDLEPPIIPEEVITIPTEEKKDEEDNVASPSEAEKASPSEATMVGMGTMVTINTYAIPLIQDIRDEAFYVVNNEIYVNGEYIESLKLSEGDHLIGAIFDNTEKTVDVKKVILSIQSEDNGKPTEPTNPTEPNKPTNPDEEEEEKPDNGNGGSSGGGNGGSNGGGKGNSGDGSSNGPGQGENSTTKPTVPDHGGNYEVNPKDPTDVTYTDKDGNKVPNSWIGDGENWRRTDENSKLEYGWFKDTDGTWYMLTRETGTLFGAAKFGWYFENQDNYWYYMSTRNTAMLLGWKQIDNKWYYFTETNGEPTYYGDNINGWTYNKDTQTLPLGCLRTSTVTPDGYTVDENGVWK